MLTLRHFILRAEGRSLYRDVLRSIRGVEPSTAAGVREAARERFAESAAETDLKRAWLPAQTRTQSQPGALL